MNTLMYILNSIVTSATLFMGVYIIYDMAKTTRDIENSDPFDPDLLQIKIATVILAFFFMLFMSISSFENYVILKELLND